MEILQAKLKKKTSEEREECLNVYLFPNQNKQIFFPFWQQP